MRLDACFGSKGGTQVPFVFGEMQQMIDTGASVIAVRPELSITRSEFDVSLVSASLRRCREMESMLCQPRRGASRDCAATRVALVFAASSNVSYCNCES
jgi:hypothetical protein